MTLATAFASLATKVSASVGAPFYAAKLILAPATPGGYNDDGVWVPGSPAQTADCLCQIDSMSEAWRVQAGFTDKDYRFLLLDGAFRDAIDTDASIKVTDATAPADFRVTWAVSALARDPAGIGWSGRGRKA
jgi:hypothetical protein